MQGRFDIREYLSDQGTRLNFLAKALLDADVPSILRFLETHPEVTSLNLENQKLLSAAAIEMLLGCRTLREINLSHIASDHISHLALANIVATILQLNTGLKTLHLTHNNFNDASMTVILAALQENTQLTHLFMGNNFVEFARFEVIAQSLRLNATLQVLHLNHNKIVCAGVKEFAFGCMYNLSIREINLSGNAIGDLGAIHVTASFMKKQSLQILLLRHNQISGHGVTYLKELFRGNLSLTKIDFSDAYVKGILERPVLAAEAKVEPVAVAYVKGLFRGVLGREAKVEPVAVAAAVQPNNDGGNNNNEAAPAENPNHAQPEYVAYQFEDAVTPTAPGLEWFDDEIVVNEVTHMEAAAENQVQIAVAVHNHHAVLWAGSESDNDDELDAEEVQKLGFFNIQF